MEWSPERLLEATKRKRAARDEITSKDFDELRLGEMLIETNLITGWQLNDALRVQATRRDMRLGQILVDMQAARQDHIDTLIAAQRRGTQNPEP